MKKEVINIRVSSDFKKDLEMLCDLKGMKLSDLGRNALTEYLDSHIDENNIDDNSDVGVEYLPATKEDDLLQSFAFAELVFWLYSRKTTRFMDEPLSIYEKHLNLINKMQEHRLFNSDILTEFNKIKKELEERIWVTAPTYRLLAGISTATFGERYGRLAGLAFGYIYLCRGSHLVAKLYVDWGCGGGRCFLGHRLLADAQFGCRDNLPFCMEYGHFCRISFIITDGYCI